MTTTAPSEVDYADIQGLVRFGYKRMTKARYELVRVKNVAAARSWLLSAPVSSAVAVKPPPRTALHIAFTAPGLRALGIPDSVTEGFSHEFRTGMATEYRARQLGDVGSSAHQNWQWGAPGQEPHLLVMFFGEPSEFDAHVESLTGDTWREAFDLVHSLRAELAAVEPFGFADGISQPEVDWNQQRQTPTTQLDYSNVTALGEVLLGYRNEYGKITDRPLLEPDAANEGLSAAQESPDKKDLGRNGTYLVMRQLQQDVRKFWQFVYEQADGDSAKAEKLAAAMVGRERDGKPLVPVQNEAIVGVRPKPESVRLNQFTFDSDTSGVRCPFGSHLRRANPRNFDFSERPAGLLKKLLVALGFGPKHFRYDLMSSVRFHRILRRGRKYGPPLTPEEARTPAPPDEPERGLHFMCLNANISRQFEFVQNAWIVNSKFSGMTGESDPLLGNREPMPGCPVTSNFNMPQEEGLRHRVSGLPQFVTVRGGAYFFLPSLRALRYFAGGA